jgi:2,3-bisphosphoglycerate-independent phosphoglycerate mutase
MKVVLCILDGFGHRNECEDNAVCIAKTPNFDTLYQKHAHSFIDTQGLSVGLPLGQMGNSEVGHTTIGAGRVVYQSLPKVSKMLEDDSLEKTAVIQKIIGDKKPVHLVGLFSDGGVHSHIEHIVGVCNILKKAGLPIFIHAITDGRDTPPNVAKSYFDANPDLPYATISGRYYAMDRDSNWERTNLALDAMLDAKGTSLDLSVGDEFVLPHSLDGYKGADKDDNFLILNFRADRGRQLAKAIRDKGYKVATLTQYDSSLNVDVIIQPDDISNTLGSIISDNGFKQFRIAETEKYAHITFFLNGGVEAVFKGEDRVLVPSPKVATYDLQPEMSAYEVCDKLVAAIHSDKYQLLVVNFANGDMVGHTGNLKASVRAVEVLDECIGKLAAAIDGKDYAMLITADHGNCEEMYDYKNCERHTQHSLNLVPLLCVSAKPLVAKDGTLADIAPTILHLMGIEQPEQMTGKILVS